MCIKTISVGKCGCQIHECEECPDVNQSGHEPTVQYSYVRWKWDYCRAHEALRRHHDAKGMLRGNRTEHGYLIKSTWANFLREMNDLKDEAYYVKHCDHHPEDENPYSNGSTNKQEAERMGTLTLKDVEGTRTQSWGQIKNESWADFQQRRPTGGTYEPRFPGGEVPQRDKMARINPLVPLDVLYPDLKGRISQERTRGSGGSGRLRYAKLRLTAQVQSPPTQSQRAPAESASSTAASSGEGSGRPGEEHMNLDSPGSSTSNSGAMTATRSTESSGGVNVKSTGKTSSLPRKLLSPGGGPMRSKELSSPSPSGTSRSSPYPATRPQNSGAPRQRSIEDNSDNVQSDSRFPSKADTPMSNNKLPSTTTGVDEPELRQLLRPVEE